MGGQADKVTRGRRGRLAGRAGLCWCHPRSRWRDSWPDKEATALPASAVEVAVLDRGSEACRGTRRAFRRLEDADIVALLAEED